MAHIAKLTNMVVATENEAPESVIAILYYKLVIDLLFNMSYIQIINKYSWTNEHNATNTMQRTQQMHEWNAWMKCMNDVLVLGFKVLKSA